MTIAQDWRSGKHRKDEMPIFVSKVMSHYIVETNLVNQQLWDSLLRDINQILTKDKFTVLFFISIDAGTDRFYVSPRRIFPAVAKNELVLQWMITKSHVAVVKNS